MHARLVVMLVIMLVAPAGMMAPAVAADTATAADSMTTVQQQHWLAHCATLQQRFAEAKNAAVTYSPLPTTATRPTAVWQLTWQGLTLALPALAYSHVALADDDATVVLATDAGYGVFTGRPAGFDRAAARQQPLLQTAQAQPTTLGQVIARGYTLTPADISCSSENMALQARRAMTLVLKTVASPIPVVAAHRVPDWPLGLLTRGHGETGTDDDNISSYKYMLQDDFDSPPYTVTYRLPDDDSDAAAVALMLANGPDVPAAPVPEWLQRLQAYLDNPDKATRCRLVEALRQADFDAQNVKRIATRKPACEA